MRIPGKERWEGCVRVLRAELQEGGIGGRVHGPDPATCPTLPSPALEEVLQQSTLDERPVDDPTGMVHALVRGYACRREERHQVSEAVYLPEGVQQWPAHLCTWSRRGRKMGRCERPGSTLTLWDRIESIARILSHDL